MPWLLSAGNIGFRNGWDRRIKQLGPNRKLRLDRSSWALGDQTASDEADPPSDDLSEGPRFMEHLRALLADMDLTPETWALSLSGGVDSRVILGALPERSWTTVSWGSRPTDEPGSDLLVAQQLADRFGTHHRVFPLRLHDEPVEMLDAFVAHSEGRTDKLAGYIDGFAVWRRMVETGIDGMIRGDELFGSNYSATRALSWANMGLATFGDYLPTAETRLLAKRYPQRRPAELKRRPAETMAGWRNRLREQHEQPTTLAALNQIRSPYVEMVNPLLCRSLVRAARRWDDDYTVDKAYLKRIVAGIVPDLAFADHPSIMARARLFDFPQVQQLLIDHLHSQPSRGLLPDAVRDHVVAALGRSNGGSGRLRTLATKTRRAFAFRELRFRYKGALPVLEPRNLALRAYIVSRTRTLLTEDSRSLTAPAG